MSDPHVTPSDYQRDCSDFYRLLRQVHTDAHLGPQRIDDELHKQRYTDTNHPSIRNLNTFFEILHRLCGDGADVRGIDFGCGSHWFVHRVRSEYGWSAVGYDPDAHAIDIARQKFPDSAEFYRCRDPLKDGLPEPDGSQTFVMSNAVLQHFNDDEMAAAMAEMARVIRPGGYCLLIFKRWTPQLATDGDPISSTVKVLDADGHKVLFDDPTMKKQIDRLDPAQRAGIASERQTGRRLLHLFESEQIMELGARNSLHVKAVSGVDGELLPDILTYRSGKGVPTVCVFLQKLASDE